MGNTEDDCLLQRDSAWEETFFQWLITSSHLQGFAQHHLYCRTLEVMIQIIHLQIRRKCLLPKLSCVWPISYFCKFYTYKYRFFWSKQTVWNHPPHYITPVMGKSVLTCTVSTNITFLRTTSDITSENGTKFLLVLQPTSHNLLADKALPLLIPLVMQFQKSMSQFECSSGGMSLSFG